MSGKRNIPVNPQLPPMNDETTREIILEAAALLVQERDVRTLSFADIAAAAEIDRDELERQFPSLDDLVKGVVERMYLAFLERIADELGDDDSPGAWTRAFIRAGSTEEARKDFPKIARVLLSTVAYKPELIEPIRAHQVDLHTAMQRDGIEPMVAYTVRIAMDGLFLSDMFAMDLLPADQRDAFLEHLTELTRVRALEQL